MDVVEVTSLTPLENPGLFGVVDSVAVRADAAFDPQKSVFLGGDVSSVREIHSSTQ
jgi:hypothetical protein